MAELEEAVRGMVLEGLGVAEHHEPLNESTWHLFRMWEYKPAEKTASRHLGYSGSHQDTTALSLVCQAASTRWRGWRCRPRPGSGSVKPSPASIVVMVGNALRAWTNDRLHAPFHRVIVRGDATKYSAVLFSILSCKIQAPDELVDDDEHPPRFKPYYHDDFTLFYVSEEGARHEDKLKAYCGI